MAECGYHQENVLIQAQKQDKRHRSLEASKQMVYDVFCSILALLEELETRELTSYGNEQFEKSNIRLPDQTKKMDEDVEAIIQTEILALSYQLKCFESGSRKALRKQLRVITFDWITPRKVWKLTKSEDCVNSLFEVLYNRTYTLDNTKCDSFSDEDLQGLLLANEQCYRVDEAFRSDPNKKASLPYIRKENPFSTAYSETGTSVDPPFQSMEDQEPCSLNVTTSNVQSDKKAQPQNQGQQCHPMFQNSQHLGNSGLKGPIPDVQPQVHQSKKAQPENQGHQCHDMFQSREIKDQHLGKSGLEGPIFYVQAHKQIQPQTQGQQCRTNKSICLVDQMAIQGSKESPLFFRFLMDNDKIVCIWCISKEKTYTCDAAEILEMMKRGGLKDIFHLKSSPFKVFIGDISVISQSLFQAYRVALDGTEVDSFDFALDSVRDEDIQRALNSQNITYEWLQKHYEYLVSKIQKGQGSRIYRQKLSKFINLKIDPKQLEQVKDERKEEAKEERMRKENVNSGVNN